MLTNPSIARKHSTVQEFAEQTEKAYRDAIQEPLARAKRIGEADIVIGIPFYNETTSVAHVVETARQGLRRYFPDSNPVIVAAGSPAGGEALKTIQTLPEDDRIPRLAFLLGDERNNGKGWSIRAIFDVAATLGADVAVLEADLKSRRMGDEIEGLAPDWIYLLLEPVIRGNAQLVVSRFNQHYLEAPISTFLGYPLLSSLYNQPIHRLIGSQWGISYTLLRNYLKEPAQYWTNIIGEYGIDSWIATTAIASKAIICEANLGIKIHRTSVAKNELVLRQAMNALFTQIVTNEDVWNEIGATKAPMIRHLASFGAFKNHEPDEVQINPEQMITRYKQGFNKFYRLYESIFPKEVYQHLVKMAEAETREFLFPFSIWAQILHRILLEYAFSTKFTRGDFLDALVPLQSAFVAGFASELQLLEEKLQPLEPEERKRIILLESDKRLEELVEEFRRQKPDLLDNWERYVEALKPPVPQITYREFIPGVPLVVPTELIASGGRVVRANEIYDAIFSRQKQQFDQFVYEKLGVSRDASSLEVTMAIKDFLRSIEEELLPGIDLSTVEGTQEMANIISENFPHGQTFSAIPEMASRFLAYYPPLNLITKLGYGTLDELLLDYDPLDALAFTNWTEGNEYMENLLQLVADGLRSEHFAQYDIKLIVVRHEDFPALVEMRGTSWLDKLTSRIIISNLHKGMGGEFPKIRYLTTIGKNIVEAERFGEIWRRFASERKDFGRKVVSSIRGHWGRDPLSAHNIFEDGHQRILVERVREMADRVDREESDGDRARAARYAHLRELAECYHLAIAMPDGRFVTCSPWSWASYSFKGGRKTPPPLSLHVERDWASREFLVEYYKAIGGTEEQVYETIVELIEQGREWENLAPILLGTEKGAEKVIPSELPTMPPPQPEAKSLTRYTGNPVLQPIKEHKWESKYVLNAGAIRLNTRVYLVYRAYGDDEKSRLGLAISEDGFNFTERLDQPIFEPGTPSEKMGCEDPRLTLIGDRIYMAYTAYDGLVAQIALASIKVKDFLNHHWSGWHRHGLVFPGFDDKDAAMFPEKVNGKFAMLHRVDPHMWITFSPHMRCPWPRREHKILAGTTTGMMWDALKIGAGAQPIKTKYGWLLITHGVDYAHVYRLGVMLLDLADPSRLVYRSPNYVLEPDDEWEIGKADESWVPNVVFCCGALPVREDHIFFLGAEDELLVYYGAADTVIGVSTARIKDLIPEEYRNR